MGGTEFTATGGTQPASVPGLTPGVDIFSTISAAVAAASPGDTINVSDGTYNEVVNLNKMLSLRGNQAGLDARGRAAAESILTSGAGTLLTLQTGSAVSVIDGFTVSGGARGIESTSGPINNLQILNNRIVGFTGSGVFLNDSGTDITVDRNVVDGSSQTGSGAVFHLDTDNFAGFHLTNNHIVNGGAGHTGFFVDGNQNVGPSANRTPTISGNLFDNNAAGANLGTRAFGSLATANSGLISGNTFSNNAFDGLQGGMRNTLITQNNFTGNDRWGLALTSFGNMNADRGAQFNLITANVFANNTGLSPSGDVLLSSTQAAGTISTNVLHFNSFGSTNAVSYSGTESIDATCNWWGNVTGPTTAANPGGVGGSLTNPSGGVDFQPWLLYDDANGALVGFQVPTSFTVNAQTSGFTATNNNYRRLVNAIDCIQPGQTVTLSGTFDWTEANALASWALGNDGVVSAVDDYSLLVPANVNNVTVTAASLGSARIQGPGDLAGVNLEGTFVFDGGDNQNWTLSNLEIFDFDLAIGMFNGAGGSDAFNGTTITNNSIRLPADLNTSVAPADVNQNIAIHYSFGTNQTISNNQIEIVGSGLSDSANNRFSSSVGMQSNTSGGNVYNGLQITGNVLTITGAQAADPATVLGIWENAHGHTSNITVSNNQVLNLTTGGAPASNLIRGFRVTSHSGAGSTVLYQGNTVTGANIGFQWIAGSNFAGNQAVRLWQNTLTNNHTGVLVQSNGIANLFQNAITASGAAGVNVASGMLTASGAVTNAVQENLISGGTGDGLVLAAGVGVAAPVFNNDLGGNTGFAISNQTGNLVNASGNYYGVASASGVAGEVSANVDYTPWLDAGTDTSGTAGFQGSFAALHVDDSSPQVGSTGRIREGIDLTSGASPTVIVEAGTYLEEVLVNKTVSLLGANAGVNPVTMTRGAEAIVDGVGSSFNISASDVILDGLTIQGQTGGFPGASIWMQPGTNGTEVRNNIIQNNVVGIFVSNNSAVNQTVIEKNLFQNNTNPGSSSGHGIYADEFTAGVGIQNILIDSNRFTNSSLVVNSWTLGISNTNAAPFTNITYSNNDVSNHGRGMYFFNTDGATVSGNTIAGTSNYAIGIFTAFGSDNNANIDILNNVLTGNNRGIFLDGYSGALDVIGNTFNGGNIGFDISDASGFATLNLTNHTMTGNTTGGTIDNVTQINLTTSAMADTVSVDGFASQFAVTAGPQLLQTTSYSDVAALNVFTLDGSDTIDVAPSPSGGTTLFIDGDPPTPAGPGPGDTLSVNLTGTSNPTLSATSTPNGYQGSYTFANRQSVDFTEIEILTALPDVAVTKSDSPDPAVSGGTLMYTIVVANNGTVGVGGVSVTDVFPAALTNVTYTSVASGSATGNTASGMGNINDTVTLPTGSSITYTVSATISSSVAGTISNTATASPPAGTPELSTANNSDTETTTVHPTVFIDDVTQAEGNAGPNNFAFAVRLSAASAQTVTVNFATANGTAGAGSDYTATSGTVTFAPGSTMQTVTVAVNGDTTPEPHETFFVNLSGATGAAIADAQGRGTIQNDDATLTVTDQPVNENAGPAVFRVRIPFASVVPVTVNYTTTDNTAKAPGDYTSASGTLTFAPGTTQQLVTVAVVNDTTDENSETFFLDLSGASGATIADSRGVGTILDDDDPPTISIGSAMVMEGNSGVVNLVFTVSLSAPSGKTVSVNFATRNGTATAGSDYVAKAGTLVFVAGETMKTITVQVNGDTMAEANETMFVDLSAVANAVLGTSTGTGTIQNDD